MNPKLKALIIVIGIIMSTLISGCVEELQQNDKPINTSTTSTPFFPQQKENPAIYMDALLEGELVLVDGCLYVDDNYPDIDNYLLVWPYGFSLSTEGGVMQVVDDTGQPVARVGDRVEVGGGECVKSCKGIAKYSTDLPSDRCSGPYWIVGEVITGD